MAGLLKKLGFGGSSSGAHQDGAQPAAAAAAASRGRPSGGPTLLFSPQRPKAEPASAWKLPADALGGGSEVARAVVSLYMQTADQPMSLKFEQCLLLLVKQRAATYEFKVGFSPLCFTRVSAA
jgi:hypothetical protein